MRAPGIVATAGGLVLVGVFYAIFGRFFPNAHGGLGHDYAFVLPELLDGYFWYRVNGVFAVPWFTPSFCGGLPSLPDPQSLHYTLPQLLTLAVDPLSSVKVTLVVFAAVGFWGFYVLLRRGLALTAAASWLGATLFLFNGLYAHRMIIGHFSYHAFMLLPLTAFALLRAATLPGRLVTWERAGAVILAALLIAYAIVSGMVWLLPPFCITLVLVAAIAGLLRGSDFDPVRFAAAFLGALAVAAALCAAKLAAVVAFTSRFPRDLYPIPGFASLWDLVRAVGQSLFWAPADELARQALVNVQWPLGRHEFEFGVTWVALALILIGAPSLGRLLVMPAFDRRRGWTAPLYVTVIALLLLLPLALNYYTPAWNAFLKQIPVLRSSSNHVRWFAVYVPITILLAALALERSPWLRPRRVLVAAAAVLLVIGQNVMTDRAFYDAQRYDPTEVLDAYALARAGMRSPAITEMMVHVGRTGAPTMPISRNNALVRGQSQILCYQPVFGYRLETFPIGSLHPGLALDTQEGRFNVKNPACYLFPDENRCAPGDHFRVSDRAAAERFLRFQPFPFAFSARQQIANGLSLITLAGVCVFLITYLARATRRLAARWRAH